MAQLSVPREAGDTEIRRAFALIGMPGRAEFLDRLDHLGDVLGGKDDALGLLEPQHGRVFKERLGVGLCVVLNGEATLHRVADDFVFHVGDVHHVVELEAARAQPAAEDVLEGKGPQVADVDVGVDGRSAGVHPDRLAIRWGELFETLRERVVEAQSHETLN